MSVDTRPGLLSQYPTKTDYESQPSANMSRLAGANALKIESTLLGDQGISQTTFEELKEQRETVLRTLTDYMHLRPDMHINPTAEYSGLAAIMKDPLKASEYIVGTFIMPLLSKPVLYGPDLRRSLAENTEVEVGGRIRFKLKDELPGGVLPDAIRDLKNRWLMLETARLALDLTLDNYNPPFWITSFQR